MFCLICLPNYSSRWREDDPIWSKSNCTGRDFEVCRMCKHTNKYLMAAQTEDICYCWVFVTNRKWRLSDKRHQNMSSQDAREGREYFPDSVNLLKSRPGRSVCGEGRGWRWITRSDMSLSCPQYLHTPAEYCLYLARITNNNKQPWGTNWLQTGIVFLPLTLRSLFGWDV